MIGTPRVHHQRVDSTNRRARELAAAGAPHGTIVTADEQTEGRGRQGRSWVAAPGTSLLMSLVLRGLDDGSALLPLAAAVAVAEACESVVPVSCRIKWPNDVWIDRRKVAGVLVEGRPAEGWGVLGIGLNVGTSPAELPPELRDSATSLRAAAGDAPSVDEALQAVVAALDARLRDDPPALLDAWRSRDALRGERVRWADGEGTATGIDDSGSLLVETPGGELVALAAGEVHLLR